MELKLVRDVKSHKGFYKYTGNQRETQEYNGQLTDIGFEEG